MSHFIQIMMDHPLWFLGLVLCSTLAAWRVGIRLQLSRAKHPSLLGHANLSRRLARFMPFYSYTGDRFFSCDGAPPHIAAQRKKGLEALSAMFSSRFSQSVRLSQELAMRVSDVQFTSAYRVPFQFRAELSAYALDAGQILASSQDKATLFDLDNNALLDISGSYGVNLFGYDFYRNTIEEGSRKVSALGPVLGYYHPLIAPITKALCRISGLEEVSFHMSGTEAVMQAVRLARYHTGRSHLVRFCGAYHGWWGDVQPGIGNPTPAHETYTLRDMHQATLKVLETRKDIACVLINPLQALHPNQNAPGDAALIDSSRKAGFDRSAYTEWLKKLREVCSRRGIILIFDEVFTGFRLARGGAQQYFGVQADLVTYGKSLGGGFPVGVLCGKHELMKRYHEDRPSDICFARGTFNSHPYVLGAMHSFLEKLDTPEIHTCYQQLDSVWEERTHHLNQELQRQGLPLQIAALSTIWTVLFTRDGRYHWMLQYYLRTENLALSWVGSGRFIFCLNLTDEDYHRFANSFVSAARRMAADGWWSHDGMSNRAIRRQVLKEMIRVKITGKL